MTRQHTTATLAAFAAICVIKPGPWGATAEGGACMGGDGVWGTGACWAAGAGGGAGRAADVEAALNEY